MSPIRNLTLSFNDFPSKASISFCAREAFSCSVKFKDNKITALEINNSEILKYNSWQIKNISVIWIVRRIKLYYITEVSNVFKGLQYYDYGHYSLCSYSRSGCGERTAGIWYGRLSFHRSKRGEGACADCPA